MSVHQIYHLAFRQIVIFLRFIMAAKLMPVMAALQDWLRVGKKFSTVPISLGRWVAKLVARLLAAAALWVRIQTKLENTKWTT
jgi:hypothetical protein